jgi:hypothetical protein
LNATGRGRRDGSLIPLVPPVLLVVSKQSRATRLPPAGNWVRFSCSIPRLFLLSHNMPMTKTMSKLASFWRFSITARSLSSHYLATGHCPYSLATRHLPPAIPDSEFGDSELGPLGMRYMLRNATFFGFFEILGNLVFDASSY